MNIPELIERHGLASLADPIQASIKPAAVLYLGPPGRSLAGESRIGGRPDLPASMEWPRTGKGQAYGFLVQINLAQVGLPELPAAGMMYVFAALEDSASDVDAKVVLYLGQEPLHPADLPPAPLVSSWYDDIPTHRLHIEVRPDIPHWATSDFDDLVEGLSDDENNAVEELGWALHASDSIKVGQVLGHAASIGHDTREDAMIVRDINPDWLRNYAERRKLDMSGARRWRNLLVIDSCRKLDLCFSDAGYLSFLIHEDDLKALDFHRVYVAVESS